MTSPRRALAGAALLAMAALAAIVPAAPALADAALAETNPAEGAILDAAPSEIVLTFNEELMADALHEVQVVDPAGTDVVSGDPTAEGAVLTIPIDTDAEGALTVNWSVVSIDTHRISGSYQFGIGEGAVVESHDEDEVPYRNQQVIEPATLFLILGAVVAAGAVLAIVILVVVRSRSKRSETDATA